MMSRWGYIEQRSWMQKPAFMFSVLRIFTPPLSPLCQFIHILAPFVEMQLISSGSGFWAMVGFLSGVSADFLKEKFPVVFLSHLHSLFCCLHDYSVFQVQFCFKICATLFLLVLSYRVSERPPHILVYLHDHVYLYFLLLLSVHIFFNFPSILPLSLQNIPPVFVSRVSKWPLYSLWVCVCLSVPSIAPWVLIRFW